MIEKYNQAVTSISFGPATHNLQMEKAAKGELGLPALKFAVTVRGLKQVDEWVRIDSSEYQDIEIGSHKQTASCVSWNSNFGLDQDVVATSGDDKIVIIWNREDNKWNERATIGINDKIKSISWNGAGMLI